MRYVDQPQYGRVTWQQIRDSARQAAERAVALDPTLADSQIAKGEILRGGCLGLGRRRPVP